MNFEIHNDELSALRSLTSYLLTLVSSKRTDYFNLALSGGNTAKQLFALWLSDYKNKIPWYRIRFFWNEECCVSPSDNTSNYGEAYRLFLKQLCLPGENILRIHGEDEPEKEAKRYSTMVTKCLPSVNGLPHFDGIILGVGTDGHVASIFPASRNLLEERTPFVVTQHPRTGQKRITLTGPVILNDTPLLIPIIGPSKALILDDLKKNNPKVAPSPAAYIVQHARRVDVISYVETPE
jgi:6-phosphogluconolactonase